MVITGRFLDGMSPFHRRSCAAPKTRPPRSSPSRAQRIDKAERHIGPWSLSNEDAIYARASTQPLNAAADHRRLETDWSSFGREHSSEAERLITQSAVLVVFRRKQVDDARARVAGEAPVAELQRPLEERRLDLVKTPLRAA